MVIKLRNKSRLTNILPGTKDINELQNKEPKAYKESSEWKPEPGTKPFLSSLVKIRLLTKNSFFGCLQVSFLGGALIVVIVMG